MPVKPWKSRTITISLPPEMLRQVRLVREEEGRDTSELVREAVRLYLEERELRRQERLERRRSRRTERTEAEENGGEESNE